MHNPWIIIGCIRFLYTVRMDGSGGEILGVRATFLVLFNVRWVSGQCYRYVGGCIHCIHTSTMAME